MDELIIIMKNLYDQLDISELSTSKFAQKIKNDLDFMQKKRNELHNVEYRDLCIYIM